MAIVDLHDAGQPMDPKLLMAIESAFKRVCLTEVQFVPVPRAWHHPSGSVNGPNSDRKAKIKMSLMKRDGNRCAYCAREFVDLADATLDHVIPNAIVRHWEPWNLLLACEPCNNVKADKVPLLLLPLLLLILRELSKRSELRSRNALKKARKKANRLARKQRANQVARTWRTIEDLAGHPLRLELEAAPARAALPSGQDDQR